MRLVGEELLEQHYAEERVRDRVQQGIATLVEKAQYTLMQNKECFVAQFIIQNPNLDIKDYTMIYQPDWANNGVFKFWIEKNGVFK